MLISALKLIKQYPWAIVPIVILLIGLYAWGRKQYEREMREGWNAKKRK